MRKSPMKDGTPKERRWKGEHGPKKQLLTAPGGFASVSLISERDVQASSWYFILLFSLIYMPVSCGCYKRRKHNKQKQTIWNARPQSAFQAKVPREAPWLLESSFYFSTQVDSLFQKLDAIKLGCSIASCRLIQSALDAYKKEK